MSLIQPNPRVSFRIAHEDEALLVVEKPARVVTLPGVGHEHDTLLNGLFATHGARLAQLGKERSFGLLHRLDRDTSGLVIVALRIDAYEHVYSQFQERSIAKYYWALVHKPPREPRGVIRLAIEEYEEKAGRYTARKRARVSRSGKPSLTAYRVIESGELATLIEARPVTGRMHQVRVHLDAIGCGILGDEWYGPKSASHAAPRLALHAHRLCLQHPVSGEALDLRTRWPSDLRKTLSRFGLHRPDLARPSDEGEHEAGGDAIGENEALGPETES